MDAIKVSLQYFQVYGCRKDKGKKKILGCYPKEK